MSDKLRKELQKISGTADPLLRTPEEPRAKPETLLSISGSPRRIRVDLFCRAEQAIYNAVQQVEEMGADLRLTDAVILLGIARECVADFEDDRLRAEMLLFSDYKPEIRCPVGSRGCNRGCVVPRCIKSEELMALEHAGKVEEANVLRERWVKAEKIRYPAAPTPSDTEPPFKFAPLGKYDTTAASLPAEEPRTARPSDSKTSEELLDAFENAVDARAKTEIDAAFEEQTNADYQCAKEIAVTARDDLLDRFNQLKATLVEFGQRLAASPDRAEPPTSASEDYVLAAMRESGATIRHRNNGCIEICPARASQPAEPELEKALQGFRELVRDETMIRALQGCGGGRFVTEEDVDDAAAGIVRLFDAQRGAPRPYRQEDVRMLRMYSAMFDGERNGTFADLANRLSSGLAASEPSASSHSGETSK